jgi:hypothetical protein
LSRAPEAAGAVAHRQKPFRVSGYLVRIYADREHGSGFEVGEDARPACRGAGQFADHVGAQLGQSAGFTGALQADGDVGDAHMGGFGRVGRLVYLQHRHSIVPREEAYRTVAQAPLPPLLNRPRMRQLPHLACHGPKRAGVVRARAR